MITDTSSGAATVPEPVEEEIVFDCVRSCTTENEVKKTLSGAGFKDLESQISFLARHAGIPRGPGIMDKSRELSDIIALVLGVQEDFSDDFLGLARPAQITCDDSECCECCQ